MVGRDIFRRRWDPGRVAPLRDGLVRCAQPLTGRVSGVAYWFRRDADRWIRQHKNLIDDAAEREISRHLDDPDPAIAEVASSAHRVVEMQRSMESEHALLGFRVPLAPTRYPRCKANAFGKFHNGACAFGVGLRRS